MKLTWQPLSLRTRHEFRISRGGSDLFQSLAVTIEHEGRLGRGEVAAAAYHGETRETATRALERWAPGIGDDPWARDAIVARCREAAPGNRAALAGLECALWDLCAQEAGVPLYRLLGLDPAAMPLSSLTLGIADWETMERKLEEAREFPILKLKVGVEDDLETVRRVRHRSDQRLTVDANAAWTREEAMRRIPVLADLGVTMVEQPLPADDLEGYRALHGRVPLPVWVDESVCTSRDVARFAGIVDGVNFKLAKTGGIGELLRGIAVARAHELAVMIGCMIESSLGITAAAHVAPRVDHLDLDGHWLLAEDPFEGVGGAAGRLVLPDTPGLGVRPRAARSGAALSPSSGGSAA